MNPRNAALMVMAKMALSDGEVSDEERDMLQDMLPTSSGSEEIEAIVAKARDTGLEELIAGVSQYEDRFFIALRAYAMAHVDQRYDVAEAKFYEKLLGLLELEPRDRRMIRSTEAALNAADPRELDPRLEELYRTSSFAGGQE